MYTVRAINVWPDGRRRWFLINADRTMGVLAFLDSSFNSTARAWYIGTLNSVAAQYSTPYTSVTLGTWVSAYNVPVFTPQPGGSTVPFFAVAIMNRRIDGARGITSCSNGCQSGSSGVRGAVQGASQIIETRATSFGAFDLASQAAVHAVAYALYDSWMNTRASDRSDALFYASAKSYVGLVPCQLTPNRPDCIAAESGGWGTSSVVMEVVCEGVFGDRTVRSFGLDSEARLPADLLNPGLDAQVYNWGNTYSSAAFRPYAAAAGGLLAGAFHRSCVFVNTRVCEKRSSQDLRRAHFCRMRRAARLLRHTLCLCCRSARPLML